MVVVCTTGVASPCTAICTLSCQAYVLFGCAERLGMGFDPGTRTGRYHLEPSFGGEMGTAVAHVVYQLDFDRADFHLDHSSCHVLGSYGRCAPSRGCLEIPDFPFCHF